MKTTILYLFSIVTLLMMYSCTNQNETENIDSESLKTRALETNSSAESQEASLSAAITRKWEFGTEYIDLNNEGTFEAVLDGKHVKGRWGLTSGTEELRTLKLIGKEDGAEGNANTFNRTYELIDVSYDRLVAVDGEGHKINFFPEK